MKYILTSGWEDGVATLTERLAHELSAGRPVLWLVSGGSNIKVSVQIMGNISEELSQNLSIMLADERYGPAGHQDSNWTQLLKAGWQPKKARLLPVLEAGLSFEQAAARYNQLAKQALSDNEVVIAQLGIGEDGHIAGILPGSPAVADTPDLVVGYDSPPYKRLTLTFAAFRQVTAAYAFAFGDNKGQALRMLKSRSLPLGQQPAQILKSLPEAYLYNDQVGVAA